MRTRRAHFAKLSALGDAAPSEFVLFEPGVNRTRKGPFLFDEMSAASCLAAYREHGADLMVDWDHLSVAPDSPAKERRAAGWGQLEIRPDGSAWCVGVKWTDEAKAAIEAKQFRYTSPFFAWEDGPTGSDSPKRITAILNVALCNLPATDGLQPLIAAAQTSTDGQSPAAKGPNMNPADIAAILGLPPESTAEDIMAFLKKWKEAEDAEPLADKPADGAAAMGDAPKADEAIAQLCQLTGFASPKQALDHVRALKVAGGSVAALSAKVTELSNAIAKRDFDAVISKAEIEGRVTPGNRAQVIAAAAGNVEALSAIVALLPAHKGLAASAAARPQASTSVLAAGGKKWEALSTKEAADLARDNPEQFASVYAEFQSRTSRLARPFSRDPIYGAHYPQ